MKIGALLMYYNSNYKRPLRMIYTNQRSPIRIDPPSDIEFEGRDSGASSPPTTTPQPADDSGMRIPTWPEEPDIRKIPKPIEDPRDRWQDRSDDRGIPDDIYDGWPQIPEDYYPPTDIFMPDDSFRTPDTIIQPDASKQIKPPPYESDTFIHNGQKYQCKWVYCCQPVGASVPEKLEPNQFEDKLDMVIWQDETFPEYTVDKCPNALGFCLSTRESVFRVMGRIIYPKNVPQWVLDEVKKCLEIAVGVALTSIGAQIMAMESVPPSIPAIIPTMLETAYIAGKTSFFTCIESKASYDYLKGKVRFTVFHDQSDGGAWRRFNEEDALKLLEKFHLYSTGLILIPGIGSYEDLAKKIGVDTKGFSEFFKNPGNTVKDWGRKMNEGFNTSTKEMGDFFGGLFS